MEFGERKRRRKSQSFKLVTDEDSPCTTSSSSSCKEVNSSSNNSAAPDVWVGEEGMEIKRQITGMMRLLSDKSGRVYQRTATEQDSTTKEPLGRHLSWPQQPAPLPGDQQCNSWNAAGNPGPSPSSISINSPNSPGCGQQGTCSKATRINITNDLNKVHESKVSAPPAVPEAPCCMCNCKGTLQAILREMRVMRRLMVTQKGCIYKEKQAALPGQPGLGSGPAAHCRPRRRRSVYGVTPHLLSSIRRASLATLDAPPLRTAPAESGQKEGCEERESPTPSSDPVFSRTSVPPPQHQHINVNNTPNSHLNQNQLLEVPPDVRLAEDYDIFISKAQLDSILVNYTRSGSLLFRKLVCAFFDDATLANSLPNGKRKRGLNDNRKGLDQNIVGAIKVFTEKYCTEHRIEKLPGPRDWVQILQDQIKLARRRLKRDAAEVEESLNGPSTSCNTPGAVKESVANMNG
ncbi:BEN domain-containing protein 7 isoform X2 [Takifugu rubripes]|uniref:BEN domain containing 7 n=1 Tax=Takifugu rubripes TaxID=31033 RepID=H2TVW4_TAKRU|nr:BEN domain-containing protein 7 isoform X2 [Takifugu rubripes]